MIVCAGCAGICRGGEEKGGYVYVFGNGNCQAKTKKMSIAGRDKWKTSMAKALERWKRHGQQYGRLVRMNALLGWRRYTLQPPAPARYQHLVSPPPPLLSKPGSSAFLYPSGVRVRGANGQVQSYRRIFGAGLSPVLRCTRARRNLAWAGVLPPSAVPP